jgi:hypothetical protein
MMRLFVVVGVILALTSCSASYKKVDTGGTATTEVRLDASKSVLVAVPADGSFESKAYSGSGQEVAHKLAAEFAKHAPKVDIAASNLRDRDELLNAARAASEGYLVLPTIDHWEQRATEWSGRPSRLSVGVAVVDVSTGQTVTSTLLESRSRIMSLTGTSPESLLPHLIGNYVNGLYRP